MIWTRFVWIWWSLLMISAILIDLGSFISVFLPEWFFQGDGLKSWKGNVKRVIESGGILKKDYYTDIHPYICDSYRDFNSTAYTDSAKNFTYNELDTLCQEFTKLDVIFYRTVLRIDVALMFMFLIQGVCLNSLWRYAGLLHYIFYLSLLGMILQGGKITLLMGSFRWSFDGDCGDFSDAQTANICFGSGLKFKLFVDCLYLEFYLLYSAFYVKVIGIRAREPVIVIPELENIRRNPGETEEIEVHPVDNHEEIKEDHAAGDLTEEKDNVHLEKVEIDDSENESKMVNVFETPD